MKLQVIIIGSGGHAKVLLDALKCQNQDVLGVTDVSSESNRTSVPFLGTDDVIDSYSAENVRLVNGVGSIRSMNLRKEIYVKFKSKGYKFLNVIHPGSVISRDTTFGEGVQIMAGAVIQTGSVIGDNSIINTRASVDHDCYIGSHVHVAPGVTMSGGVIIEDECHLGTASVFIQGIRILKGSFIKANSLNKKNTPKPKKRGTP